MDADKFPHLSNDDWNNIAPVASPTPTSSPRKRKLTRSPTPHTLADHPFLDADIDEDHPHPSSSTVDPSSSQNTAAIANIGSCSSGSDSFGIASNYNRSSSSSSGDSSGSNIIGGSKNDRPFRSAKMTLFAALTKQTPEDAELARLTKANTKANRIIGKSSAPTFSASLSALSDPEALPRESSSSSPPKTSLLPQSSMALPSFPQRDIPTSPLYMADNELESESENEGSSDSFTALSTRSPSLSPQLSLPEFDQHRMKRRRADPNGRHTDESNMRQLHVEPLPVQDQVVSGSPHCHQNSRAEDTDNHYLSSPSSTPSTSLLLSLSQHTDPSDSFSVLKPKKTVRFDETKNAVFGYQRGSTIALPNAEHDNEETDYDEMWREDPSNTNRHSGHGHSLTPLSRWSSMATSKMSGEPTLSDLEAASPIQIHKANQLGPAADEARSTREAESIMKECDPTSSDQTDQRLSCTNTASNLERLWSPPRAKKSFSDASAAKFMSNTSPPSSSDTPGFTGPRMIPLLRRQHSMPLMDTLESREMFNLEESRPLNRRGSRIEETFAKSDLESVIAPHVSQRQSGDQDIVMCEEPQRADWAHLISPPKRLAGGARGPVRNRKVAGRYQHPYRRPIMPVLDPVLPASTSSPPSAFSPPKLVRSASFTVTRQKAPPLLRRKASTTALMDTFR